VRELNRVILHCSATREGQDVSAATIKDWHVNGRGWSDIGYHYVIRLDGTIEKGRPIHRPGAHTKGHNAESVGVCYIGGVEQDGKTPKDTLTLAQEKAFRSLYNALQLVFGPMTLHGHNEYAAKACPSFNVTDKFPDLCKIG
jgi:N-acetylmuramoyl-L-alanine amidase